MQFQIFIKHWNRLYKKQVKLFETNQQRLNNLQKTNQTIQLIGNLYQLINFHKCSFYQGLLKMNIINQKSKIYYYIKKINQLQWKDKIPELIIKDTGPKEITYKYDKSIRKEISDDFYINHENRTNIWLRFKKKYDLLSIKTVCKIINQDDRNKNKNRKAIIKHYSRYYNIPFGNIQMDLKIIGPKESPTGKRITIFDAKDEQSKLYFMKVIENASKINLLQATVEMIDYFENELGMKIKRIRTDNAMCFKRTNFVRTFEYDELLKYYNIENQKIPLGQPQCNGVIERQHGILDQEFVPLIDKFDNTQSLNQKSQKFMKNFNFFRHHYYNFLSKCNDFKSYESRFFIPFEFFNTYSNNAI